MFAVIIPANEKSVYSGVSKLLVGKALFGKHVCKYFIQISYNITLTLNLICDNYISERSTPSNAEVSIGIESTVDDP